MMTETEIANVVRQFGISPEWVPAYSALVREGRIISRGFMRLIRGGRFALALGSMKEILTDNFNNARNARTKSGQTV